jgi:hypothetical protein
VRDVIEPQEIVEKTGLSGPHTVHCMPGDIITVSMLGDRDGNLPGGLAVIDARDFSVVGQWANDRGDQELMYDFWYQPRQNTLVSSEWGAPNTFKDGFDPADVAAGRYGRRLHFWDLDRRTKIQMIDLGEDGLIPLEIRWQRSRQPTGVRRCDAVEQHNPLSQRQRLLGGREGDRRPQRAPRELAAGRRRTGPDHRPGAVDRRSTCPAATATEIFQ